MFRTLYLLLLFSSPLLAQNFVQETELHRKTYKEEFLKTPRSPLKEADLRFLRFYAPDSAYRVHAAFKKITRSAPFEMPTYNGMKQTYVKYGTLRFRLLGKKQNMVIYRSLSLQSLPQYRDYLFLPFKDKTNGSVTYGGGRYIDLKTTDLKNNMVVLDFNKAYNPYCAYSDGYSCPIPPAANHMSVVVEAGEKIFAREH